ncbi:membrane protein [Pseudomonas sp. BAY1663]|nr:membrane protein [Pseudomonas sp. BAY1663]
MVGSAGQIYRVPGLELLSIADNTALYLWGMLGVFGVLLYLLLFPLLLRLQERGPRLRNALLPIVFCLCLVAWATDVLEVTTATLFLGLAISHVLTPARAPTGILAAQRLPELQRLI